MITANLTSRDHADLIRIEKEIESGIRTWIRIGRLLSEIKDRKLYRLNYPSWEEYCEKRWGFSGRQGYYLASGAEKVDATSQEAKSLPPLTPFHLRNYTPDQTDGPKLGDLPDQEVQQFIDDEELLRKQSAQYHRPGEQQSRWGRFLKHIDPAVNALRGVNGMEALHKDLLYLIQEARKLAQESGLQVE
jgi:hypothetical protein